MMIEGVPIVTMSLGEERVFRLRPWKGAGFIDFPVRNGTVIVMPYVTNKHWTHEVPHFSRPYGTANFRHFTWICERRH